MSERQRAGSAASREREEWEQTKLGDVAELVRGVTYKSSELGEVGEGVPFLSLKSVTPGGGFQGVYKTFTGAVKPDRVLASGDLVIAVTEQTRDYTLIGAPALVPEALDGIGATFSMDLVKIKPTSDVVSTAFLNCVLQGPDARRFMAEHAPGMKVLHLRTREVPLFKFLLPPLHTQERIVEVIGAVDDQITALDAEAGALEGVYRAATSLLWCTAEGGEAQSRFLGEVMHLDLVRTPMKSGTTYQLAGVLNAGKGLVDKGAFDGADTEYTAMNILRENQVVMRKLTAWEGPITVVPAEFDGFVASNEFPTFTLAGDTAPGWMKHVCRTPRLWAEMQSRVVGTVQRRKRLNPDQLLAVALPVPSRPEQEQAAEALDAMEGQVAVIRAEVDRLRKARAELLSNLLSRTIEIESGELEV